MKLPSLLEGIKEFRGRSLAFFIVLKVVIYGLWIAIAALILRFVWQLPARELAIKANLYSNFIIALLTFALVAITGFYAVVTYQMLVQIREGRRSDVRPLLWVNVGKPIFTVTEYGSREFSVPNVVIANYGKGSAVSITARYEIPYEWNVEHDRPHPIQASVTNSPTLLSHGESFETEFSIRTPPYELQKFARKFLQIRILYEDTERNLYKMDQIYDLFINDFSKSKTFYYLSLKMEKLIFVAFSDRRYVGDMEERVLPGDEDRHLVIYHRKSLF